MTDARHEWKRTECGNRECVNCGCLYGPSVTDIRINGPWAFWREDLKYETKKDPGCKTKEAK